MIDREGRLGRQLGTWVVWSARHARLVVVLAFGLVVPLLWYSYTHLRVDADTRNLVSDQLPWRQANAALERAFPHLLDDMQIVIDAASPEIAAEAQRRLAEDLAARTDVFSFVYAPGGGDFFDRHGFLYSSTEELEELGSRMRDYRWMWLALEEEPTLGGLASAVNRIAATDSTDGLDVASILLAVGGAFYSSRYGYFFTFPGPTSCGDSAPSRLSFAASSSPSPFWTTLLRGPRERPCGRSAKPRPVSISTTGPSKSASPGPRRSSTSRSMPAFPTCPGFWWGPWSWSPSFCSQASGRSAFSW